MTSLADIPFSLLDLASVTRGSSIGDTLQRMFRCAQHADKLGFERFWLAEHHNMEGIASSATSVLIGQVAAKTEKIRVGSGGIMLPNHPPLVVAEQFGTLDCLFPGRIDLGLGRAPGTDPVTMRALYRDERRADFFPDEVSELQRLLGPDSGPHPVKSYPGSDSKVDIWLLGSSLFSAQLAAQRGLPYAFAGHFAPPLARQALNLYHQLFQPSDVLEKPYAILCLPVIPGETDEEAQYLLTSAQQRVIALRTGKPLYLPPPVETMEGIWSPMERMQVEAFLDLAVVGGPETVKSKLTMLAEQLPVQEFMFSMDIYDEGKRLRALELLAEIR